MKSAGRLAVVLTALALLYSLWGFREYALLNSRDFGAYVHASRTLHEGGDLYAESGDHPPFVYPPYVARLFEPFTEMPAEQAPVVWFWIRSFVFLGLVGVLLRWWCKSNTERAILLFLFAFGFRHALRVDFAYGNITVFEQFFLWAGIAALVHGRAAAHVVGSGLTALVKTTNVLLIPLVAVVQRTRGAVFLSLAGVAAVLGIHVASAQSQPLVYEGFRKAVEKLSRGDHLDYTVFTWLRMNLKPVGSPHLEATPTVMVLYGLFALGVGVAAFYSIRRTQDPRLAVCVYLAAFALVAPRFKDYQHLLMVPVAAVLIGGVRSLPAKAVLVGVLCLELFGLDLIVFNLLLFGLGCALALETDVGGES
jgi:hypothetical protein